MNTFMNKIFNFEENEIAFINEFYNKQVGDILIDGDVKKAS